MIEAVHAKSIYCPVHTISRQGTELTHLEPPELPPELVEGMINNPWERNPIHFIL